MSQISANLYGNKIDRLIHFNLGHRHWARYMDDIVVLENDPSRLRDSFNKIKKFSSDEMGLGISRWQVSPTSRGINFLGYRIWSTHKLLRKDSVTRAKRKIKHFVKNGDDTSLMKFVGSWSGHAKWADTNNLINWLRSKHGITI